MDFNIESMGKRRLIDKSIQAMSTVQAITPANFIIQTRTPAYGAVVLGDYKGQARFVDLDKLVNQPLVLAEKQHILGILDGREEGYDLATVHFALGAIVGATGFASITVPSGLVFFVHGIHLVHAGDATAGTYTNFRITIWPSREDPVNEHGQSFWAAEKSTAAAADLDEVALFYTGAIGTAYTAGITAFDGTAELIPCAKDVSLRIPAGETIRLNAAIHTAPATAAIDITLTLHGYVGKLLVA